MEGISGLGEELMYSGGLENNGNRTKGPGILKGTTVDWKV